MGRLLGGLLGLVGIATLIGFGIGGLFLALIGIIIGRVFFSGYTQFQSSQRPNEEQRKKIQETFFKTVFLLLGHLAKADGRVSEAEIKQAENFMSQMGLTPDHRREAIRLFKEGSAPSFNSDSTLHEFRNTCGRQRNLIQMLIMYLVNMALADGNFDASEEAVLKKVASSLGISSMMFEQMLRMIKAQGAFAGGAGGYSSSGGAYSATPNANQIDLAYQALGVKSDVTDTQLKRAYRKLMSQYHPDKLTGQGVPEDMIKSATERSQEIQAAYDLIKKSRG
ncbi:MAG: co-chaperone DjlA [Cellvibrionaceae bacterium]